MGSMILEGDAGIRNSVYHSPIAIFQAQIDARASTSAVDSLQGLATSPAADAARMATKNGLPFYLFG